LKEKLNIALFSAALLGLLLIVTVFPRDYRTIERENRALNVLPELTVSNVLGGSFGGQFESYVSDRVYRRADFVTASMAITGAYGVTSADGARVTGPHLELRDGIAEIFISDDVAAKRYADAINAYRAALPDTTRVFSVIAPTRIEFMEDRYKTVSDSEKETIDAINAQLDTGVTPVDAYAAIAEHISEYEYFRTDHHWTALGAYYAYTRFAQSAGITPVPLTDYESGSLSGFLGYLYNYAPSAGMRQNPDTITYYEKSGVTATPPMLYPPSAEEKVIYGVFLGGDHPILELTTSTTNGRTAVVIKDSYANAFVPFLAPHYETIVIIDPRTFEGGALDEITSRGDADVIFVNYVFTTTFRDFIAKIDDIR
jgi:hypothetical protein